MGYFPVIGFIFLYLSVAIEPLLAATCTISKYNANDIISAAEECTQIILNGIEIPSGKSLNLNLKRGTKLTFQGKITWGYYEWNGPLINITGTDLEISGARGHMLDGRGKLWWDGKGEHGGTIKPVLFHLHGAKNVILHDLNVTNTPLHAIWIERSENVIVQDIGLDSYYGYLFGGQDTDGFNILASHHITMQRIKVYSQGDCVAIKSGTNIRILDILCSEGNGISIGSVGGRDYNIVEDVHISNAIIVLAKNGVRVRTTYGATGSVNNIIYEDISMSYILKFGIIIEGDIDIESGMPTGTASDGVPITNLILRNITGHVVEAGVNIYVLVKNASDWNWSGINVNGGEVVRPCEGVPQGSGITC